MWITQNVTIMWITQKMQNVDTAKLNLANTTTANVESKGVVNMLTSLSDRAQHK